MRPTRLELEGFASFRQPTTIDFGDADLFVLSGPTGSGKSSVIDAITFCLYGVVARYDDKRIVEPVISKGRNEARVSLQFSVDGVNHTAVRVVRRTRTGASTKEARLERWRGDDPADARAVADNAADVSTATEALLGLGYDHFTRTVVLPQGAFQEFLHGSQSERADLLNQLLAVDVFDRVARQARTRASTLQGELKGLQARLDGDLAEVTDEQLETADTRVGKLQDDVDAIDEAAPKLEEILTAGREQAATVTTLEQHAEALEAVTRPEGLDDLVDELSVAGQAVTAADEQVAKAEQARDEADARVDDLPSPDAISNQVQRVSQHADLAETIEQATAAVTQATTAHDEATQALAAAEEKLSEATAMLDHARQQDLVATLAEGLHAGDDCPVCRRELDAPVEVDATALQSAREAHQQATAARDRARTAATEADKAVSRATSTRDHHAQRREQLATLIDDADLPGDLAALEELATQVKASRTARDEARAAVKEVRATRKKAQVRHAKATERQAEARATLTRARDHVADQQPPSLDLDDLAGAWATLVDWVEQRRATITKQLAEATKARQDSRTQYKAAMAALRDEVADDDIDAAEFSEPSKMRDAYVQALHEARTARDTLRRRREQREQALANVRELQHDRAVATTLGQLLSKRNFQKWLTTRAVRHLVVAANRHLDQLSGGAYALTLDDGGSFAVVDHANGGEQRPARSLSGGETFLASLSLALALSESVADLAAGGAAKLESLFIDEGFGTLDAATIDVVRTALEELGATGRMVGVVTHVPALAEQLPVQFKVRKQAQTSVIERVEP